MHLISLMFGSSTCQTLSSECFVPAFSITSLIVACLFNSSCSFCNNTWELSYFTTSKSKSRPVVFARFSLRACPMFTMNFGLADVALSSPLECHTQQSIDVWTMKWQDLICISINHLLNQSLTLLPCLQSWCSGD